MQTLTTGRKKTTYIDVAGAHPNDSVVEQYPAFQKRPPFLL